VSAWRGNLVDHVLSHDVIPAIGRGEAISAERATASAMDRFDRQLAVGRQHRIHEPGFKPSALGEDFAAFYAMEYGDGVSDKVIGQARDEVRAAIIAFFAMEKLIERLSQARRLITQRHLFFTLAGVKVRAVPDVIILSQETPPAIIDWKVHAFGRHDAWLQLAIYAAALTRTDSRLDYQIATNGFDPTDVGLLEVQLLTQVLRRHRLSEDDLERAESYAARTSEAMTLALGEATEKTSELSPASFPAARFASTCETCPYRCLCWETLQ
jgi:hypothetical protein